MLEWLEPVVEIFVSVAAIRLRVGMIGDYDQRCAILHRVVHVRARQRPADTTEASHRSAARCLRKSVRHRDDLMLGCSLDELQIGPVDDGVTEGTHAGAIANEDEVNACGAKLLGQQLSASALKCDRRRMVADHGFDRSGRRMRSSEAESGCSGELHKPAPRDFPAQILIRQVSHGLNAPAR